MNTTIVNATEYRDLPLTLLTESKTNPRRIFEENALKELADFVPGNKIGLLCRSPFCGRGRQKAHGSRRSTFQRVHNG
jgi:ParB family chromosome partitioning protein